VIIRLDLNKENRCNELTAYHVITVDVHEKYDKVMIMNVALLLADVRSACILGDEPFTELVVKSFSELDSMKRSSAYM
jgi:hypothetical protein